jgi:hypothetical protein
MYLFLVLSLVCSTVPLNARARGGTVVSVGLTPVPEGDEDAPSEPASDEASDAGSLPSRISSLTQSDSTVIDLTADESNLPEVSARCYYLSSEHEDPAPEPIKPRDPSRWQNTFEPPLSPSLGMRECFAILNEVNGGVPPARDSGVYKTSHHYVSPENYDLYRLLYDTIYGPQSNDNDTVQAHADRDDVASLQMFQKAFAKAEEDCYGLGALEYCDMVFSHHQGGNLLYRAAESGSAMLVRAFAGNKKLGRLEKIIADRGKTLLLAAASDVDCEAVSALLEAGANVHAVDSDRYTILHLVVEAFQRSTETDEHACCAIARKAIAEGVDRLATNSSGRTALEMAIGCDAFHLVDVLVA